MSLSCSTLPYWIACLIHIFMTAQATTNIRINGTSNTGSVGRIEVFYNGMWGTVCDDEWDINDARVACRQLGFSDAIAAFQGSSVEDGTGKIWLDDVVCSGNESSIFDCTHPAFGEHNCGHYEDAGVSCLVPVRLVGLLNASRVEVFYNGTWGTVCDDGWDINDARVVCRQLGFTDAEAAYQGSSVVSGTGQIWMNNVQCSGTESSIFECAHKGWGNKKCTHGEDVGVRCSEPDVRIYGSSNYGRIQVFFNGMWGTICNDNWDINDANVVCRQLGFHYAKAASHDNAEYKDSEQFWLSDVHCNGKESSIFNCRNSGWGIIRDHCNHYSKDAGVWCSSQGVRIIGSENTGRVEVFYNGTWGTICDDGWDINDARVVCRQVGLIDAEAAYQGSSVVSGTGQIWLNNIQCSGTESSIFECAHKGWGNHNCNHGKDAGVRCSGQAARLSNGSSNYGRVEVLYNGIWGTVCNQGGRWNAYNARVVCRQLGFPDVEAVYQREEVVPGTGIIWIKDVECNGDETSVFQCRNDGWGKVYYCEHRYHDVGVRCSTEGVHIIGSENTGRVEVFYNGTWGTVCDDGWDINDAHVVCRQVGLIDAEVAFYQGPSVVSGTGHIWLNNVQCSGTESSIFECAHKGWANHNCNHGKDAGVRCSGQAVRLTNGSSNYGRVEVLYNGIWGTVCDYRGRWNVYNARVVCRQLGFPDVEAVYSRDEVVHGTGIIWINNVQCIGDESSLFQCPNGGWGKENYCWHNEGVGVRCSTNGIHV